MKIIVIAGLILMFFSASANSEELFEGCATHKSEKGYFQLFSYLEKNQIDGNKCQRLNNSEFLYTTENNFYFCRSLYSGHLNCEESDSSRFYPQLTFLERFYGGDRKQFVLFKTSRLSGGYFATGFQVFYLVPKSENSRGYVVFDFFGVGDSFATYEGGGAYCNPEINIDSDENQKFINPGMLNMVQHTTYKVLKDENGKVIIRFNQEQIDCRKRLNSRQLVEYVWNANKFQKSKEQILETGRWDQ